jgi:hypothetical protein
VVSPGSCPRHAPDTPRRLLVMSSLEHRCRGAPVAQNQACIAGSSLPRRLTVPHWRRTGVRSTVQPPRTTQGRQLWKGL